MTREEALKVLDTIPTIGEQVDALEMAIKALELKDEIAKLEREWGAEEIEPCEDVISRQALRQKLREHYDFFVNAYGGFNNLSLNDKFRVDEIKNCIAMVVNAPSVTPQPITLEKAIDYLYEIGWMQEHDKEMAQPKVGEWLKNGELCKCSNCHSNVLFSAIKHYKYCYHCGSYNGGE